MQAGRASRAHPVALAARRSAPLARLHHSVPSCWHDRRRRHYADVTMDVSAGPRRLQRRDDDGDIKVRCGSGFVSLKSVEARNHL